MAHGRQRLALFLAGAMATLLLPGCVGAPLARQIASSIGMRIADNVTGQVVDRQLRLEREQQSIMYQNTAPDPYLAKFLLTQLPEEDTAQVVVEPLPQQVQLEYGEAPIPSGRLVPVEIWNLVIGEEKQAMLERSQHNGSQVLPPPDEWSKWQLAMGNPQGHTDTQLYFLVPPDFGRVKSGDHAIVEIATVGGLHVARYRAQ